MVVGNPPAYLPLAASRGCLPSVTCSPCAAAACRTYFRAVGEAYDADWVVKMDDDVYLAPQRLLAAAGQWDQMSAGAQAGGCLVPASSGLAACLLQEC